MIGGRRALVDKLQQRVVTALHAHVDPRQARHAEPLQFRHRFSPGRVGPAIGSDPPYLRELLPEKREDLRQFIGFQDQGIGILQKYGLLSPVHPGADGAKGVVVTIAAVVDAPYDRVGHPAGPAHFPGQGLDLVGNGPGLPDIILDLRDGAEGKFFPLVGPAKGALVPGTIPRYPEQQAPGLAGRPDRPLFKRQFHAMQFPSPYIRQDVFVA